MKKLLGLLALGIIVIVFVFSGSGKGADLLILNWGDYLSSDVIHSFEEKYGVTVKPRPAAGPSSSPAQRGRLRGTWRKAPCSCAGLAKRSG